MSDGIYCLIALVVFFVSCVIFGLLARRIEDLITSVKVMIVALIACASVAWLVTLPLFLMGGLGFLIVKFFDKKK